MKDSTPSPAELALLEENRELRARLAEKRLLVTAVDCSEDAIITSRLDGLVTTWNQGAERLFGYTATEAVGGPISIISPADLVEETATIFTRMRRGEGMEPFDTRRSAKDGRLLDVSVTISPVYDADGSIICASTIIRDISARKRFEAVLHGSEERIRLATEATGVGIWEWDLSTGRVSWDAQMFRIYGIESTQDGYVSYDTWREVVLPDDLPRQEEILQETIRDKRRSTREFRIHRAGDGKLRHIQSVETVRIDARGVATYLVGTNLDVTERKLAEQALHESREDLNRAQAVGSIGSWRLDVGRNVLTWSDENHRIFGVPMGTPLTYQTFLGIIHPDDREYVDSQWIAGLRGEPYDIEHRILVEGRVKWVREKAYLEFGEDGALIGGFGITQDITGRKLAELALREANHRKDEFLAMLAHELRNPLAPIRNAVHILNLKLPKDPTLEQASGMIERQVSQLVRLVDDLLDVSRVSRGKIELRREPVELAAVIHQAVETSQPLIEAHGHTLNMTLPARKVRLIGDFTRLAQVVGNLLNNAAKYTDEGGLIQLTVEQNGDAGCEAAIHVCDNGRGIDPAAMDNLFDLFYQAECSIDRTEGGLGIGLSLVKRLVELHDGRVEARSAGRGKGSEFIIHLPCLPDEPQPTAAQISDRTSRQARHPQRILVVDDNPDVADSMSLLLTLHGHQVVVAHNGKQAVEMALQVNPGVILLDIGLPDLDGYQACRAMRQMGLTETLIIAMTGYGQLEDQQKAEQAGIDLHMTKPVDPQRLARLLDDLPQAPET